VNGHNFHFQTEQQMATDKRRRLFHVLAVLLIAFMLVYVFSERALTALGEFLILDENPVHADAVVVCTGPGWYPRLMEAAALYQAGLADKVVINGNRKTQTLRRLEQMGYQRCCPWYEGGLRILAMLDVPRAAVITVSAEDAYDTVSEAKAVGQALIKAGISSVIVTTSKYHTRRAGYIWKRTFANQLSIRTVVARNDPFSPQCWWKEGRQVRWVMAEYGAWIYYFWKKIEKTDG
jgi:uncharacterized SAM-binding protein YcdF (DUF218 family)